MENHNHIHKFNLIDVPSTCKENGYTLHKCDCGYEHKDNFKPLGGHSFVLAEETKPTCTSNGTRIYRCVHCGEPRTEIVPFLGHAWGNWNLQTFPTCVQDGSQMHICSRCGLREDIVVPAKGHKLTSSKKSKSQKGITEYFCENCGQIVCMPTFSAKIKRFISKHKVAVIFSFISLLLVAALIVSTFVLFVPNYHYSTALNLIEDGDYAKAYYHLTCCENHKDSEELLENFDITYEKTERILYDEDGNISAKFVGNKYGDDILYVSYDENGSIQNKKEYEYTYNLYEDKVVEHEYDDDGSSERYTYEYKYDAQGDTILKIKRGEDGDVLQKYEYEHNEHGDMTLYASYSFDYTYIRKYEYEYSDNGDITLEISYDENNNVISKTEYTYDEGGNLIIEVKCDKGDITKTNYIYSDDGELISAISYDENNVVLSKSEYHDTTVVQINYKDNGEIEKQKFIYEYDENKILKHYISYSNGIKDYEAIYQNPIVTYKPDNK